MSVAKAGDLTRAPLAGICLRFGSPLAVALMGHGVFNLVDAIIVGRVGQGAIAAVTISGLILTVVMLVFDGVSNITAALTAQGHAAGRREQVHAVAWESLWLSLASGVGLGLLFWALAGPMVGWFGLEGEQVRADAIEYQAIMSLGTVTMFLIMQTTAVLRGVGNSLWPLAILVGSNLLNVLLDILMVFGYWGFPEMGVAGAAWATGISRGVGGLVGFWVMWRGIEGLCLRDDRFRWRFRYIRSLLLVGLPTSLQLGVRVLSVTCLFLIASAAYTGSRTAYVDGLGVCLRLEMVAVFMGMGWGAAATAVVGQNLGARRVRRAHVAALWLVLYGMLSMGLCGLLIWIYRYELFALIGPEVSREGVEGGIRYLAVIVPVYPLLAVSFIISRSLNGAGSVRTPMLIDIFLFILLALPLAAVLSGAGLFGAFERVDSDPMAVWWVCMLLHVVAAVAYSLVWWLGRWRRKRLGNPRDEDFDDLIPAGPLS